MWGRLWCTIKANVASMAVNTSRVCNQSLTLCNPFIRSALTMGDRTGPPHCITQKTMIYGLTWKRTNWWERKYDPLFNLSWYSWTEGPVLGSPPFFYTEHCLGCNGFELILNGGWLTSSGLSNLWLKIFSWTLTCCSLTNCWLKVILGFGSQFLLSGLH